MNNPYALKDIWDIRHRYCEDTPASIDDLDEARYVATTHGGHGGHCLQYSAASRTIAVAAAT